MTSQPFSSARYLTREAREEARFLRDLKAVAREVVSEAMLHDGLTQEGVAKLVGLNPGHLSRLLSPDRHNTTKSLHQLLYKLGRRWTFGSMLIPGVGNNAGSAQQPAESDIDSPKIVVSGY